MEFIGSFVGLACLLGVAGGILLTVIAVLISVGRGLYHSYKVRYDQYLRNRSERELVHFQRQRSGRGYRNMWRP